jgi:hypothetical protein
MPTTTRRTARRLPAQVFHIAEAVNWPSIQRDGLLSTDALLRRDGLAPEIERRVRGYRPAGMSLPNGIHVRDQSPMPPEALGRCLDDGLTPEDWYRLVNGCVFFWIDPERVERHLHALRRRAQVLLTIDAEALAEAYATAAFVTPFNVGAARRKPARRGLRTFVPLGRWSLDGWAAEAVNGTRPRSPSHPPSELVIRGTTVDIMPYVVGVREIAALT